MNKPIEEFALMRQKYRRSYCRACHVLNNMEYVDRNRAAVAAYKAKHRKLNYEKYKPAKAKWREENKEKVIIASAKAWRKRRAQHNALIAKRRANKLLATPPWANKEKIKEFYVTADGLQMLTGEWYNVDHIVPLQGKRVCGLHCEFNLQVIPKEVNLRKHNKFDV